MTVGRSSLLDRLPSAKPCLAAVFTSYAFDPRVFEERLLHAVLGLSSDPIHQPGRFLDEARARLQATPVAVIVDAGQRQPGRRMPYDLLDVDEGVFHPKLTLLLYDERAYLQVGSGNITAGGYGGNAELFMLLELDYEQPEHSRLLLGVDGFLERCANMARHAGTQLKLVREELARRLQGRAAAGPGGPVRFALLDGSRQQPLIEQIFALVPDAGKIRRVGVLAPYFESDAEVFDERSVFGRLLARAGPEAEIDVGMAWDNPSPICEQPVTPALADGLGELWCRRHADGHCEYLIPLELLRTRFRFLDQRGQLQHGSIAEADEASEARRLWPVGPLRAFAPSSTLNHCSSRFRKLSCWLFPATTLADGRPRHRGLHAKLITVVFEHAGELRTLVVAGSANISRAALLRGAGAGGNVEVCLGFCLAGEHPLYEFAPELVHVRRAQLELNERQFPELGSNFGLCIESAIHDPGEATLVVRWDRGRAERIGLPAWQLRYGGELLFTGVGAPAEPLRRDAFTLRSDNAELTLEVGEREFSVAILVSDLARLPVRAIEHELSLHSLLLVLGGRLGREQAAQIETQARSRRQPDSHGGGLDAIFGEGFGPVEVFRAWWGVGTELRDPARSVQAFRVALAGSVGLETVWAKLRVASEGESPLLSRTEAWLYGAELLRELEAVMLDDSPSAAAKAALLEPFIARLRTELGELAPNPDEGAWLEQVLAFYRIAR